MGCSLTAETFPTIPPLHLTKSLSPTRPLSHPNHILGRQSGHHHLSGDWSGSPLPGLVLLISCPPCWFFEQANLIPFQASFYVPTPMQYVHNLNLALAAHNSIQNGSFLKNYIMNYLKHTKRHKGSNHMHTHPLPSEIKPYLYNSQNSPCVPPPPPPQSNCHSASASTPLMSS